MRFNLLIFTGLLLASCSGSNSGMQQVSVPDQYTLSLPAGYHAGIDLHDYASIQFIDDDGAFLVGLREEKGEMRNLHLYYTLDDYAWFVERTVRAGLDTVWQSVSTPYEVGGVNAIWTEIDGSVQQGDEILDVSYNVAVLEGKNSFYQLVQWGYTEDAEEFTADMQDIICSFRISEHSTEPTGEAGAASN